MLSAPHLHRLRVLFFVVLTGWAVSVPAAVPSPRVPRQERPTPPALIPRRTYRLQLSAPSDVSHWEDRRTGMVSLYHGGRAAADGRDIVVTDPQGVLPHRVLQAGPGDFLRIAFHYRQPQTLSVLFGEAKAALLPTGQEPEGAPRHLPRVPASSSWQHTAGLLLTTWPLPEGAKADSWPQMQRLLAQVRKTAPYGSMFVPRVFHGYHPFPAPAETFVSAYEGWIGCARDGNHVFATSSDDASFLLINGKLVVAWPGSHGPRWDAKHNASIRLTKGVHHFAYYHVNLAGPTTTCAAWKPPGHEKVFPITATSFAPVAAFGHTRLWKRDPSGEFKRLRFGLIRVANQGEARVGRLRLHRFGFSVFDGKADPKKKAPPLKWEYGDGVSGQGRVTSHVYLTSGLQPVRVENLPRCLVRIGPDPSRAIQQSLDRPEVYVQQVAGYPFDRLRLADLEVAVGILTSVAEHPAAAIKACRAMLARQPLAPAIHFRTAMLLGERLRPKGVPGAKEAVQIYRNAISALPKQRRKYRANLIREIGDTLFYYQHDLDGALNEYDKVVGRYADVLESNIVRITKIKIGDVYRQKGEGKKAKQVYDQAEALMLHKRSFAQNTVRKGSLYKAIDDFLKRGETSAAREWIEILEWEYPLEKLDGYSSILRARIALAEKNSQEAIKQLEVFVNANPRSAYSAEAIYELATLLVHDKKTDQVQPLIDRLRKEYAESPFAEKAQGLLPKEP